MTFCFQRCSSPNKICECVKHFISFVSLMFGNFDLKLTWNEKVAVFDCPCHPEARLESDLSRMVSPWSLLALHFGLEL